MLFVWETPFHHGHVDEKHADPAGLRVRAGGRPDRVDRARTCLRARRWATVRGTERRYRCPWCWRSRAACRRSSVCASVTGWCCRTPSLGRGPRLGARGGSIAAAEVHLFEQRLAGQKPFHVFEERRGHFLRDRGSGHVGRDDDVVHPPERMFPGQRFHIEHVQDGAGQSARLQGAEQGLLLDDGSAAHVDQIGSFRASRPAPRRQTEPRVLGVKGSTMTRKSHSPRKA